MSKVGGTRKKTGGRKKGTPNKTTAAVREAILFAADAIGGQERLAEWAKESPDNEKVFWASIYPKLLPLMDAQGSNIVVNLPGYVGDL